MKIKEPFGNLEQFLSFDIMTSSKNPCHFVFNVQKIKEVVEVESFNNLPPAYYPFVGIYDLRGMTLPVLTLEIVLSDGKWSREQALEANEKDWRGYRMIVLDLQGFHIGVLVGEAGRLLDYKSTQYLPSPETIGMKKVSYINGMLKQGEKIYYLLDIESILADLNGGLIEKSKVDLGDAKPFAGLRVLVAEDSGLFRKKARELFSNFGCELTVVNDGEAALQTAKSSPSDFDLIFTDIEMPIRNGVSFIRELKKIPVARDIPVIFNSSLSNEGLIRDIQTEKLGDYIIKYDEKKIFEAIRRLVRSVRAA